jgi:RNA polymerase sigma-70 factor (ECF subfamily)
MPDAPEHMPALLARAAMRDEAAARALVEKLGPLVQRIILGHAALRHECDDLMQDIFFKVFRSAANYSATAPVEHWVATIAKRTCLNRLRHHRSRPELTWSDLTPGQQAVLDEDRSNDEPAHTGEDARALIERLLAALPPADAWLLRAIELEERSLADVCSEAGWNATLTRVRLFRARRRLKQALINLESHRHEQR